MFETSQNSRGRPRDLNKRNVIVDAGRKLFGAGGNRPVTVREVLKLARVSRGTFYSIFTDIDDLLEAVVRRESDRIIEDIALNQLDKGELRDVLVHFGINLLTFLSDEKMQAFERRLTAEVSNRPELALRFFKAGPARARDHLVVVVAGAIKRGELVPGDAGEFVSDLIGLWQGFKRLELVFHVVPFPTPNEIRDRVVRGVDLFLRLYRRTSKEE